MSQFPLNNQGFTTPGFGQQQPQNPQNPNPQQPIQQSPPRAGIQPGFRQPINFQQQPNFRQTMPTNTGINGQPQSGNIGAAQTFGTLSNIIFPGSQTVLQGAGKRLDSLVQQPSPSNPASGGGAASGIPGVNTANAGTTNNAGQYSFNGGVNSNGQSYNSVFGGGNTGTDPSGNTGSSATPPVTPPAPTPDQTPDRFAQLTALQNNLGKYYQPTDQETQAMTDLGNLNQSAAMGINKIRNTPGEAMDVITGASEYLRNQAAAQAEPLKAQLSVLQARRQAAIDAAKTGIGAETAKLGYQQPVTLGIGQGLYSPVTGQSVGGNSNGGNSNLISNLADAVQKGTSYQDAVAQLPSAAMAPQLFQELHKRDPNFSITTSNQNAQARGNAINQQSTTVRPMVNAQQTAIQHLQNLQGLLNKVNYSNMPIVNGARQWFSNNISTDPNIQNVQSEINVVRGEVAKVLGGGSVTVESQNEAKSIVPDNLSPQNFQAVTQNIQKLMQSKIEQSTRLDNVQQYPQGTQPNQSGGQSSGGAFSW